MSSDSPIGSRVMAFAWFKYETSLLAADTTAAQRLACQRAFYAGAFIMFSTITEPIAALSEEDGRQVPLAIRRELDVHMATVGSVVEGKL